MSSTPEGKNRRIQIRDSELTAESLDHSLKTMTSTAHIVAFPSKPGRQSYLWPFRDGYGSKANTILRLHFPDGSALDWRVASAGYPRNAGGMLRVCIEQDDADVIWIPPSAYIAAEIRPIELLG